MSKNKKVKKVITSNLPRSEKEHLKRLIKMSEDAVVGDGRNSDDLFKSQAVRLKKQLNKLVGKTK